MNVPVYHRLALSRRSWFTLAFAFVISQLILWSVVSVSAAQTLSAPEISNVTLLTPSVARFEKVEIRFDVATVATHLNLPFDAAPPAPVEPGIGVSVDALFSSDNWQTTITQPAFYYQPFEYSRAKNRDHWVPGGMPHWLVRFAPRAAGDWQVRLVVKDKGGTTLFPAQGALKFNVYEGGETRFGAMRDNPYTRRGFLRVSQADPRYFEFEDGTPFIGLGYNAGSGSVENVQARYRNWQQNGLQFARVWMSGSGINASQWTPWAFPAQPMNFGLPTTLLDMSGAFDGSVMSYQLNSKYPCLFTDFWQGGIPVEPNETYSLTLRARVQDVTPKPNAAKAGFTVIREGWIGERSCNALKNPPLFPYRVGTSDWFTETTTLQTGPNENFLDYLYLVLQNTNDGIALIDSVELVKANDPARANLIRDGRADSHLYFDDLSAAKWDLLIQQAEEHGVYLKIVADEKNEWIRNVLNANGVRGKFDNNNFYGAPDTQVRWLDEAWWRYLIARWGYSTAIHSYEFVNEGDPYNGNLYNATNAMARYFERYDPSQHMVTTSFWHSFPNKEFWSNPRFRAVDYADIHAYVTTGWGKDASFIKPEYLETRPEFQFEGKNTLRLSGGATVRASISPRGVTINEPGEWVIRYRMKQENFVGKCNFGEGGSNARVYWQLDTNKKQGAAPNNAQGKLFLCTSPEGTFDWREFDSTTDRNGRELPMSQRLVLTDTMPHELTVGVQNSGSVSGDAWISDIEVISPSGKRVPVLGTFDTTSFNDDPAWWTAAYSLLWGGASPVGGQKPLVRGETALDVESTPDGMSILNQDRNGKWLHDFVWGQINSGGMYDLWWYGTQNIEDNPNSGRTGNLYPIYRTFSNFMADVPLNNGNYIDAQAVTSNPNLIAWGQRDEANGRAHLWIRNRENTWRNAIENKSNPALEGTIRLPMPAGTYRVEWWDPYKTRDAIFMTLVAESNGVLSLALPRPLDSDVAVQVELVRGN